MWTVRRVAPGEEARVGEVLAAGFAAKYRPALGDDPALAAQLAAVLPPGIHCYVGTRAGAIHGAGLLRFSGQLSYGMGETAAVWRRLRARQSLGRALRSLVLLSLVGGEHEPDRDEAYISSLAVDPAWQGLGLGNALLDHLERAARAAGKRRLTLHVVDTNAGAIRLYTRHGFRAQGRTRTYFTRRRWGYRALLFMEKDLTATPAPPPPAPEGQEAPAS